MKVKITGFIHWYKPSYHDTPSYGFYESDMSSISPDYVPMFEHSFEVEIPDNFDPTPLQIAALRKHKEKILADAHVQANNLEEQIQRLLCLEHKPEPVL
jgi:hypothetical protein